MFLTAPLNRYMKKQVKKFLFSTLTMAMAKMVTI